MIPLLLSTAWAVEGMWLPDALPADAMRAAGWAPERLADPDGDVLGAVVHVGDGCSGSFVSDDGLVLTNHHCVWDLLQANATPEHPMVDEGYAAASPAEERWGGPTARLYVAESITDVTATVLAAADRAHGDEERSRAIDRAAAKLVDRCERGGEERRCEVSAEYGGASYRLVAQRVIRDVRLVYVPPMTVGEFGGDRDNFEWPRHDADFAVLRAYVAPDGRPAAYNPANVPYHPPHHLRVEPRGIEPGAAVAIAGYPYETQRYELLAQLQHRAEIEYPALVAEARAAEAILADEAARDPAADAALGEDRAELANTRKYLQGVIDNVASTDVLARKAAAEAEIRAWIAADPARSARYAPALAELDARVAALLTTQALDDLLLHGLGHAPLLDAATTLVHAAAEREKRDQDRDPGFRERDREDLAAGLDALSERLWLPADRRLLELVLARARALPADQHLAALDALTDLGPLYDHPRLADEAYRRSLLDARLADLQRSTDPWIRLALALEPSIDAARLRARAWQGALSRLSPVWMAALRERSPGHTYPDANNTLRVSFGTVRGYSPRDGVLYTPQTTVGGFVAKVASGLYDAPPAAFVTAARASRTSPRVDATLGDVPSNFLTDLDSTGGNSGSATVDREGRLVGLLFDGNYESMAADWLFDDATTRSIHVDIRYVLFVLDADPAARWVAEALLR